MSVVSFQSKLARLEGLKDGEIPPASRHREAPPEPPAPLGTDQTSKLEELRRRIQAVLQRKLEPRAPPKLDVVDLPFFVEETAEGPLHVRRERLEASHRMGSAPLLAARTASSELLALLALDPSLAACDPKGALYLDTETTGLHGGTGTVAFLVGLAFWEESQGGLIIEQLLVRNLGEEAPMLERVAERIARASMLVTFNGKSFDLPLLRTRFVMARLPPPKEPAHLDLIHLARRIHKSRRIECRLTGLERRILGFERQDDVPSGEVSARYLHFLRTGDTRAMLGVIEHNAWDVVAMAALVGLYGEPLDGSQLAAEDLAGVARTLLRAGEADRAFDAASRAIELGGAVPGLAARADIAKARGDRARALSDFEALAAKVDDGRVRLELAKLYEHFVKEPGRALEIVRRGTSEAEAPASKRALRLERKLARVPSRHRGRADRPGAARIDRQLVLPRQGK